MNQQAQVVTDFDVERALVELRATRDEIVKMIEYLAQMNRICMEENLPRPSADLVVALAQNLHEHNETIRRAEALHVAEETNQ